MDILELEFRVVNKVLRFRNRVCIPQDNELRTQFLTKMHSAFYNAYPKSVKIYRDLKTAYWWFDMKKTKH